MAYADASFYRTVYLGHEEADDAILARYLQRASDDIEAACITDIVVEELAADVLIWLKKATCARAEQYVMSGTDNADDERNGTLGAFTISDSGSEKLGELPLNHRCVMYLVHTGFMNRCVGKINETYTD